MQDKEAFIGRMIKGFGRAASKGLHVPKTFVKGINEKNVERAYRGYRSQAMRSGPDSFLLWPVQAVAEKALGKKRVRKALWNYVSKPALMADTAAGNVLRKTPLVGGAFKTTEHVPWGKGNLRVVERSSALAPLGKLRDMAEPFVMASAMGTGAKKVSDALKDQSSDRGQEPMNKQANGRHEDQQLREKVASAMLQLHQENKGHRKRAHAVRLLYKQAELGLAEVPHSYSEFEEKVAQLINQDLVVFEKALELTGGTTKLGELAASQEPSALGASERFQAAIIGDDL